MRPAPLLIAILILLMALIMFNHAWAEQWLIYSRPMLPTQAWRLVTSSFCHTNLYHFAINSAGLVVVWQLFKAYFTWQRLLTTILLFSGLIGLCLWLFNPNVIWYVGLSGTLHGLFSYGAAKDIEHQQSLAWLLLIGLVVKLAYEQLGPAQTMMSELIQANVMIDAHLYGAIIGLGYYLICAAYSRAKN